MKIKYWITSLFLFIVLISFSFDSFSQQWKRNRRELVFGLGATGFLGDLGGLNKVGTDYSPVDIELSLTRPLGMFGMRYQVTEWSKLRGTLTVGQFAGNDALTAEPFRNNRNLHFRSPIVELAGVYEVYFNKEKAGHKYNIRTAKGFKWRNFTTYGFVGVGGIFFNPKAEFKGQWVKLQPLGTEGQGLREGTKKYSRLNVAIPMGLGLNYTLNRQWKIGFDIGYRKTFTDYIDDVGGIYYDNALLKEHYELQGMDKDLAQLADPNLGNFIDQIDPNTGMTYGLKPDTSDEQVKTLPLRGQPEKDAYIFAVFTVSYKIVTFGSRAKF